MCARGMVDGIHSAKICLLSVLSLVELVSLASLPNRPLRDVTAIAATSREHQADVDWVRLIVRGDKGVRAGWQLPHPAGHFMGQ